MEFIGEHFKFLSTLQQHFIKVGFFSSIMSEDIDLENQIRLLENTVADLSIRLSTIEDAMSAIATVISSPKVVDANQLTIYNFGEQDENLLEEWNALQLAKYPFNDSDDE